MSTKTILIIYLIAALAGGSYLYWRYRTFVRCEQEFDLFADTLGDSITKCLEEYDRCNALPDPAGAIDSLARKYLEEGTLFFIEKYYDHTEAIFDRMSRLSMPGTQSRLLRCHDRLRRMDRAVDACMFPALGNRIAAWIPDDDRRQYYLSAE